MIDSIVVVIVVCWLLWCAFCAIRDTIIIRRLFKADFLKYKKQIQEIVKTRPYLVPIGFLNESYNNESYNTALHQAMRDLKNSGRIKLHPQSDALADDFERWVA